jgi:cysteine desulfurase / selenocysteine lyase
VTAITADEVAGYRAETPGCGHVAHLNNAGASLMPAPVHDAVRGHLEREALAGGYEAEDEAADAIADTYAALAELIGGRPEEIAFAENATRAWDMACYAAALGPRDRILTERAEYVSQHLAFLQLAKRTGASVEVIGDDEHGQIDLDALAAAMDERVRIVNLVHVPTYGGLINPATEVGAIVREHPRALYVLDACQSAGQLEVDVQAIGCDVLSAPGRKFLRGPRGTGFLWVRGSRMAELEPPFMDLRGAHWTRGGGDYELLPDARRFETWETYVAGRIGLGVAARYALAVGVKRIERRVVALAARLRAALAELPGVRIRDTGARQGAIVTFTVDGVEADAVVAAARRAGVNVNAIPAEHARLAFDPRGIEAVVRSSVHYFTTDDELDRLLAVVSAAAGYRGPRIRPRDHASSSCSSKRR